MHEAIKQLKKMINFCFESFCCCLFFSALSPPDQNVCFEFSKKWSYYQNLNEQDENGSARQHEPQGACYDDDLIP